MFDADNARKTDLRADFQTDPQTDLRTDPQRDLQTDRPHPARIYDYWLGGKDNFPPDRVAAEHAIAAAPDIPEAARENRAFLRRAVRYCVEAGVRQFIDIGSGLPARGNVHEVAQELAPDARVVYIDNDPIVLAHGRALLADNRSTTVLTGDLRDVEELLDRAELRSLIDLSQPVAVLLLAVLHFVDDAQAAAAVRAVHSRVAPGSHLLLSHSTGEGNPQRAAEVAKTWENTASNINGRGRAEVEAFFERWELLTPGVDFVPLWRPDGPTEHTTRWMYAGVGRKP
ncbi:SAM-dependent methyltransferase [Kitasatospora aureofaciens]|uniref:SAM-dependent methyltransferase n=1 Tax=Kitasatospora aureofaciens TaxID=1894 RepID=UPI001C46FB05|nr:SAM-dependent methyltransferase [Kitasatospora aureofaciens]MBV6699103.1 SAM-dependent methyltransferase [Kitasatospora aureofaciens]